MSKGSCTPEKPTPAWVEAPGPLCRTSDSSASRTVSYPSGCYLLQWLWPLWGTINLLCFSSFWRTLLFISPAENKYFNSEETETTVYFTNSDIKALGLQRALLFQVRGSQNLPEEEFACENEPQPLYKWNESSHCRRRSKRWWAEFWDSHLDNVSFADPVFKGWRTHYLVLPA